MAKADGWLYGDGVAVITSMEEYINNDLKPTSLQLIVEEKDENPMVIFGLKGWRNLYKFKESQQYVVVCFDLLNEAKWEIEQVITEESALQHFTIVNSDEFVKWLKQCEFFTVKLPLSTVGVHQFIFSTGGYPLAW